MSSVAARQKDPDNPTGPLPPPRVYIHRRVVLPDINDKGEWLANRMKGKYKHAQDRELINWLRSVCGSANQYLFVRTDHAFALAEVYREPLAPRPTVREAFVLVEGEQYQDEGGYLYSVMYDWSRALGADEMRIENLTDIPREMIKARIGKLFLRDQIFAKLDHIIG